MQFEIPNDNEILPITECTDDVSVFGTMCEIEPSFIWNIRLNEPEKESKAQVSLDTLLEYSRDAHSFVEDFLYKCEETHTLRNDQKALRDCKEAWEESFLDDIFFDELISLRYERETSYENKVTRDDVTEDMLLEIGFDNMDIKEAYHLNNKAIKAYCNYSIHNFRECLIDFYSNNESDVDECMHTVAQKLDTLQNDGVMYRRMQIKDGNPPPFVQQLKDHDGKSIMEGKLSGIGKYWSWDNDPDAPWSGANQRDHIFITLHAKVPSLESIDIPDTFAVNYVFRCSEHEIRLRPDSNVHITNIEMLNDRAKT